MDKEGKEKVKSHLKNKLKEISQKNDLEVIDIKVDNDQDREDFHDLCEEDDYDMQPVKERESKPNVIEVKRKVINDILSKSGKKLGKGKLNKDIPAEKAPPGVLNLE